MHTTKLEWSATEKLLGQRTVMIFIVINRKNKVTDIRAFEPDWFKTLNPMNIIIKI